MSLTRAWSGKLTKHWGNVEFKNNSLCLGVEPSFRAVKSQFIGSWQACVLTDILTENIPNIANVPSWFVNRDIWILTRKTTYVDEATSAVTWLIRGFNTNHFWRVNESTILQLCTNVLRMLFTPGSDFTGSSSRQYGSLSLVRTSAVRRSDGANGWFLTSVPQFMFITWAYSLSTTLRRTISKRRILKDDLCRHAITNVKKLPWSAEVQPTVVISWRSRSILRQK